MSEQSGWSSGGGGGLGGGGGISVTIGGGGGTPSVGAFSLQENGSLASTTNDNGNTISGAYTNTLTGTDVYTMTETGENSGGAYSETVTGTDTPTLTETGNSASQVYARTVTGTDVYARTDSGPGASFSASSSGTLSSTLSETSDARAGILSQSETGSDRYSLLEKFVNVANTGSNSPGNMDYDTFGSTFVDPPAAPRPNPQTPNEDYHAVITRTLLALSIQATAQAAADGNRLNGELSRLVAHRDEVQAEITGFVQSQQNLLADAARRASVGDGYAAGVARYQAAGFNADIAERRAVIQRIDADIARVRGNIASAGRNRVGAGLDALQNQSQLRSVLPGNGQ